VDEGQEDGRKEVREQRKTRASGKSKTRTTVAESSTGDARASVHVGTYNNFTSTRDGATAAAIESTKRA